MTKLRAGPNRRQAIASVAATLASISTVQAAQWIPQKASSRVIVDNDFAGDPDGLVALAHQALSPTAQLALVTTTALNPRLIEPALVGRSAAAGAGIARECLRKALPGTQVSIVAGPERFGADPSDAARAIVSEAMREGALPLFLTCGGPLTNVAAALRLEPAIAGRMTVIWIGGSGYPDGEWEYNLATDEAAARTVLVESKVPLWQVPKSAYRQMAFSVAELASDMRPISPLGTWLYERFTHPPPSSMSAAPGRLATVRWSCSAASALRVRCRSNVLPDRSAPMADTARKFPRARSACSNRSTSAWRGQTSWPSSGCKQRGTEHEIDPS